jgi:quercetin dioxygenase-like cupin family protein
MTSTSPTRTPLRRRLALSGLAATLGLTSLLVTQNAASADGTAGPTRSQFSTGVTDERVFIKTHPRTSSRFTTFRLDFVDGAVTPWHRHTGPGLVTIIEGTFVLTWGGEDGCTDVAYEAGDSFIDPGDGRAHRLRATSPGAVSATFVTPADADATAPAPTPSC